MTEGLKEAKDRVLAENTAQAVFKHLDRIEDSRAELGARWVWELFQNARDAADVSGARIQMSLSAAELRFEHDGRPFSADEITHLVYHGSTKVGDLDEIGQFGSGFLATHLLSRVVWVRGQLDDYRAFCFLLDRTGRNPDQLREATERSWEAFEQSLAESTPAERRTTSFTYQITEPEAYALAALGLKHVRASGPSVLAFCPDIREIAVETSDSRWRLQRGDAPDDGVLPILHTEDGREQTRFIAVSGAEGDTTVALALRRTESGLGVDEPPEPSPKVFVLFPLMGSERLGLPCMVNSTRFKPREDRDGIVLTGDSAGATDNQGLLEESARHQERLLQWCGQRKWAGAERILSFDTSRLPDWASSDGWFRRLMASLVRKSRETPLMCTVGGHWIKPSAAWLPETSEPGNRGRLWDQMRVWNGAEAKLPPNEAATDWSRNLVGWARLLDKPVEEMDEALTLTKVAQLVEDAATVDGLQRSIADGDALSWLKSLLELVRDDGQMIELLERYSVLPAQSGSLRSRTGVRRDEGIPEELKDIAEALGMPIRDGLLDRRAKLSGLADLLGTAGESELVDKLLQRVKNACQGDTMDVGVAPWAVNLFRWLAAQPDHMDHLEGYPVPTADERDKEVVVVQLERGRSAEEKPLAPVAAWPERARRFHLLFAERAVLAAALADLEPSVWRRLEEEGYLNASPLVETKASVEAFLPDEPLPERGGSGSHKSTSEMAGTTVAWLTKANTGLIDRVRSSRHRANELVQFFVEFVVPEDERAFEKCSVECECGDTHRTYRAAWLAPLRHRRWVPPLASRQGGSTASAESLAHLLGDSPETSALLSSATGGKLLDALGVSRADLALRAMAGNEEERLGLIHSMEELARAAGSVDRARELAAEIREHPEIIDGIEKRKERRREIQRNQEMGQVVEQILRQELESAGLAVRRTGIGSDFEIESDIVENDEEIGLELVGSGGTVLIEVKSTRVAAVKMTPVQAERACALGEGFALCVVPLEDDKPTVETIRERLRVVFGIGAHLQQTLSDYGAVRRAEDVAREPRAGVALEIVGGQTRFRVEREVWKDALTFDDAVQRFQSSG